MTSKSVSLQLSFVHKSGESFCLVFAAALHFPEGFICSNGKRRWSSVIALSCNVAANWDSLIPLVNYATSDTRRLST